MLDTIEIIKKYYDERSPLFDILVRHSRAVAEKALAIVDSHPELLADREFVCEAAMLHDIGIFMCDAQGIQCFGEHDYIEHGYLGAELLRKEGLERHALVCERHTGVGLAKQTIIDKGWNIPHRDMIPISIEEEIICFADLYFSKTRLDSQASDERVREKLKKFGEADQRKFDIWRERFS